jgi:hypothetical protein
MIVNGDCDALPEQAFYMVGTIEEAQEKAKTLVTAAPAGTEKTSQSTPTGTPAKEASAPKKKQ